MYNPAAGFFCFSLIFFSIPSTWFCHRPVLVIIWLPCRSCKRSLCWSVAIGGLLWQGAVYRPRRRSVIIGLGNWPGRSCRRAVIVCRWRYWLRYGTRGAILMVAGRQNRSCSWPVIARPYNGPRYGLSAIVIVSGSARAVAVISRAGYWSGNRSCCGLSAVVVSRSARPVTIISRVYYWPCNRPANIVVSLSGAIVIVTTWSSNRSCYGSLYNIPGYHNISSSVVHINRSLWSYRLWPVPVGRAVVGNIRPHNGPVINRPVAIISAIPSPGPVGRPVPGRTKPAAAPYMRITVTVPRIIKSKTKADAPPGPWIVMHAKAPGIRTRPVTPAIPGPVVPACAPNYGVSADIIAHIAGCIANVYILGGGLIHVHISCIISAVACRNLFYIRRAFIGHPPGPVGAAADKPDTVFQCIILVIGCQHHGKAAVFCQ